MKNNAEKWLNATGIEKVVLDTGEEVTFEQINFNELKTRESLEVNYHKEAEELDPLEVFCSLLSESNYMQENLYKMYVVVAVNYCDNPEEFMANFHKFDKERAENLLINLESIRVLIDIFLKRFKFKNVDPADIYNIIMQYRGYAKKRK